MTKSYSIAEARDNLAAIVHEVEASHSIELTRRGRPVAVLISKREYDRLHSAKAGFWNAYQDFRQSVNLAELDIDPLEIWGNIRDRSPGREVEL